MVIRNERTQDSDRIDRIVTAAFKREAEALLIKALRTSGCDCISLVAEENQSGAIKGHIMFTPVELPVELPVEIGNASKLKMMGLAPLAVDPHWQGKGTGSRLVREGLEQCRMLQVDAVVVLGSPQFYQRFGFGPASSFKISSEYDVDDAYFMLIELNPGALDSLGGVVQYQKEFNLT